MLTRLYDWTMSLAAHRHAIWWLAAISFAESSFFPIPPDVLIIAMVLAARQQAWRIATVCTIASVAGGLAGYAIGALLYEGIGAPIIAFYGYAEKFEVFQGWYRDYGAWIVGAGGFTPIPYKVITIASGVAQLDPVTFTVVSVVSRGARFFLVAALLWRFGPPIRTFIEARLGMLTLLFFAILVGSFVALRFLV